MGCRRKAAALKEIGESGQPQFLKGFLWFF